MATSSMRYQSSATMLVIITLLILACLNQGSANANAINDVNNMLRDSSTGNNNNKNNNNAIVGLITSTTAAAGSHVHASAAEARVISNNNNNNDDNESNKYVNNDGNGVDDDDIDDGDFSVNGENLIDNESSIESGEMLRFVDDQSVANDRVQQQRRVEATGDNVEMLPLNDQVRLLTKQLNALMMRRREDYELLERNLRKSLRITTSATATTAVDADVRNELVQLRHEIKTLRETHPLIGNKEKLTIDWLTKSIAEIRKQLVELQQIASNANKDISRRTQGYEDLATLRNDFRQLKLELAAMRERQERVEVFVQELREETLQQEEDFKRLLHNHQRKNQNKQNNADTARNANVEEHVMQKNAANEESREESSSMEQDNSSSSSKFIELSTATLADHKRRHCRFQRQQIHELQLAQHDLKRQLTELKYHRIGERVRSIEIEQHRIADANFNLSRQIASLDKLHTSMLELLEDVEGLQNKMDKTVPELRHEISKLEFSQAQFNSEQSLVREEGKNVARSVQAMAVSVSALQEERDGVRAMQTSVQQLQQQVDRMQNSVNEMQHSLLAHPHQHQRRSQKLESGHTSSTVHHHHGHNNYNNKNNSNNNNHNSTSSALHSLQSAENLVTKLENVEHQYESIINKLPHDCSEIETNTNGTGLYLIAPTGQHRPLMAHCAHNGWTTVQRRYDGSADFNRSWEDYATGFGSPSGEYWIGNEQLHALTQNNCTALRIHMQDIYDNSWLAEYARFYVSPRSDGYRLHISGYSGNASDALDYQQGMQFSAIDVDRDISQTHCAANYEGGWWFSHCQHANLNGRYNLGLTWFDAARNEWIAVKSSQMLIKRLPAAACEAAAAIVASESSATQTMTATRTAKVAATTPGSVVVLVDASNEQALARARTTTTIAAVV